MFEFYSRDAVSEVGGNKRIIGDRESSVCVLKDRGGVLFVGGFCDCEYVSAVINEVEAGRLLPLYLDRKFQPSIKSESVRTIEGTSADAYMLRRLYKSGACIQGTIRSVLCELMKCHSPYSITTYNLKGEEVQHHYNKMEVVDKRSGVGVRITFVHGIRTEPMSVEPEDMGCSLRWSWLSDGTCSPISICEQDPNAILEGVHGLLFTGPADYLYRKFESVSRGSMDKANALMEKYRWSMLQTYAAAGQDRTYEVDGFFASCERRLRFLTTESTV